jgi:hypothetical protein
MTVISLDQVCKNLLLKRRYSLHFYLDFLIPAKDCLRELSFDLPINTLRYKVLPLNENHALDIPSDYQDYARVSYRVGQYLRTLVPDDSLDLIPNYDSNFDIQPYSSGIASDPTNPSLFYLGYSAPYWWTINWNAFGENLGRQYGGVMAYNDTFKENRTRNEIKINENLNITEAVLEYIGDGMDADSATHINSYCQNAIEAYCMWQFKEHNRTYTESEAQVAKADYDNEFEKLTARLSDLDIPLFKRIVQKTSIAIKY